MKIRRAWRYQITYPGGGRWWGTCPTWAAYPLPTGAVLTRERVMSVGSPLICGVPGCESTHPDVAAPW